MATVTQNYASFGPNGEVVCSLSYDSVTLQLLSIDLSNIGAGSARVDAIRSSDMVVVGSRTVGPGTPQNPATVTQNMRPANLIGVLVPVHGGESAYTVLGYTLGGAYPV